MTVAVIGAGASGILAALQAAWNGAEVALFERNPAVGRKLLVTGSGHCNISNAAVNGAAYTCADPAWMAALLARFGLPELLAALSEIGIPTYKTDDGWVYPLSRSAHSVVAAFSSALDLAGVKLHTSTQVTSIRTSQKRFDLACVKDGEESETVYERVIVSAGGCAYPALGSRGELFLVLERLGHTILPARPALAPVLADLGNLKRLQGVRLDAGVTLSKGTQPLATSAGNLIFTEWGLNGPAVMDVSHHISARPGERLDLSLDLLAFFQAEFAALLAEKRAGPMPLGVLLGAFFPPKVAAAYLKNNLLAQDAPLCEVSDGDLARLIEALRDTRLPVKGVRGFEYCQISAGGVPVSEVHPLTLESRRVKGLYLCGETLDVVGPCGGYNLQYAFSSGALAGMAAVADAGG